MNSDKVDLLALNAKINAILPSLYEDRSNEIEPVSMGSASLKFGSDGKVAWDEIWTHFCDLALAGGPPHRGTLLEPASEVEVHAEPDLYAQVIDEIERGISLVTGLSVLPRTRHGWVGVLCHSSGMAAWLVRAIVAENVMARHHDDILLLPAGPHYQLAKEIKNVVVVLAKTAHFWSDHMSIDQQAAITSILVNNAADPELLEPASRAEIGTALDEYQVVANEIEQGVRATTGLQATPCFYSGWLGIRCTDHRMANWLMRAIVVENVLVRREWDVLFVPLHPEFLRQGKCQRIIDAVASGHRLWSME